MSDESPDYDSIDYPEMPNGWEWWSGEASDSYYSQWFGTEYRMGGQYAGEYGLGGMEGQVFWDEGQQHTVQIWYIRTVDENGDPTTSYPTVTESYDTMQEAVNAVVDIISEL